MRAAPQMVRLCGAGTEFMLNAEAQAADWLGGAAIGRGTPVLLGRPATSGCFSPDADVPLKDGEEGNP